MNPSDFLPATPKDLIGQAGKVATALLAHATKEKHADSGRLKLLLYGPPGTGKTTIANMLAASLATDKIDVESLNGRNLTIDVVREWQRNNCYSSMFGGWKVKLINEVDLAPMVAQDLMLTFLDELGPRMAVIGTSNEAFTTISDRFKSRLQTVRIPGPTDVELGRWLRKKFGLAKQGADWIATTCCGNVRQALLESSSLLTLGMLPEKHQASAAAVCAAKSESARRAWETMRARKEARP